MTNCKKIFVGCFLLIISIVTYASCPSTDTIKCNGNSCNISDPNFDTLGYVSDSSGKFSVKFNQVFGLCQLQEGGTCAAPRVWGKFRCSYKIGDTGVLTLEWRSDEYVTLASPSWTFLDTTASCTDETDKCNW